MYGRHQNALRRMTSLLKGSGLSKGEAGALLSNDAFVILKGEFSDLERFLNESFHSRRHIQPHGTSL